MSEKSSGNNSSVSILIVEDSPTQAMKLRHILEQHTYRISLARNGREALAMVRQDRPTMIISDVVMPEMDGYTLCQSIKSDAGLKEIPVILLTSLSDPADVIKGLQAGANNFVVKPYEAEFLLSRIEHIQANLELRKTSSAEAGMEIVFGGQKHLLNADRVQMIDLLLSTYEEAVQKNLKLQAATERLERQAEELSRSNSELEQFAYVVSHDLKEPLRMVSSFLELLARRYKDQLDDKAREFIAFSVDGAHRMHALIQDLLAYSRVGTEGKPFEPVNCNEVLQGVLNNLKLAIQDSGAAITSNSLPTITADFVQMTQLFQNLIANAIKFRGEQPPRIHITAEQSGRYWELTIRDNGIGIDPGFFDRIFVMFQRLHTREAYPGTGIGLAVCKKIVERHGGTIDVESEPRKGTAFIFSLPS